MKGPGNSPDPGLCGRCNHVRVIVNRNGSRFYLCELAAEDPRFRRYPPIPVLRCSGFQADGDLGEETGSR
jgi:hypothetical protein